MVGVGGGVPSTDVRLGDVVVSQPHKEHGGVVQYDFGKTTLDGFERTGSLNIPPEVLLSALSTLQANYERRRSKLLGYLSPLVERLPDFSREKAGPDMLFPTAYNHVGGDACERCEKDKQVERSPREGQDVVVHYGTIASGNQVMRDATERNKVSEKLGGVLCFEMEAAGLMNRFPCVVVRGICDYADSHKNKKWQRYAAATAAAYAKELLLVIPADKVTEIRTVDEAIISDQFLPMLSVVDRQKHISTIPPLDRGIPRHDATPPQPRHPHSKYSAGPAADNTDPAIVQPLSKSPNLGLRVLHQPQGSTQPPPVWDFWGITAGRYTPESYDGELTVLLRYQGWNDFRFFYRSGGRPIVHFRIRGSVVIYMGYGDLEIRGHQFSTGDPGKWKKMDNPGEVVNGPDDF